jgi:hypothetical protein
MKRTALGLVFLLWLLFNGPVMADSPIYQGFWWDTAPAVAYNSQRGEFLVVWNYFDFRYLPDDVRFFGPVMGQLIWESGEKIGGPFQILDVGVLSKVAYNAQTNEYLVVAERFYNTVGQRVSYFGLKVGGMTTFLTNARAPRVLYNSLAGNYLVAGAWWSSSPSCTLQIYTLQVDAFGQPLGSATKVADEAYSYCGDNAGLYALEYAPIPSSKAPQGRYLLAIDRPTNLKLLDSQGQVLPVLYDQAHNTWYENLPFQQSKVGTPYNIDIAYGSWAGQPAFFLIWGDINQNVPDYGVWTGIWGGIVEAAKELYYTTDPVSNEVFPISWEWSHVTYPDIYKQWKPVVKYNNSAATFVVAWRETPGSDVRDLTLVNHIRVNTSNGYRIPPLANLVVSATSGTENPALPAIGSSSKTPRVLIAWEDWRNIIGDIYGTFFNAATRDTSGISNGSKIWLPIILKQ